MSCDIENIKKNELIASLKSKNEAQSKEIKYLKKTIANLEKASQQSHDSISQYENLPTDQKEILECLVFGVKPSEKYGENVRKFALSMNFHSPRCYEFLRETFEKRLPHPSTMRAWYANSDLSCDPGITMSNINILKHKVEQKKSANFNLVVSLSLDEMFIRKQILWCNQSKKLIGYVSFGAENDDDNLVANNAIVFMATGVNEKFSLPVAYEFITSLNAKKKTDLLMKVITALIECGIIVSNITMDAHASNWAMSSALGANLDVFSEDFRPFFIGPNNQRILIFFDPVHMIKLIRNTFARKKIFIDEDDKRIKWQFIVDLILFNKKKEFGLSNKLNKSHLNWERRIMKVDTAVQTLSASAADAMEFLCFKGIPAFVNSEATIRLMRLFNRLFDIFNAKSSDVNNNEFKIALNATNKAMYFEFFDSVTEYIKKLKFIDDAGEVKNVCLSKSRSGFVGFIICMKSLNLMFADLVEDKMALHSIPTYYLLQDPLEIFFGKIRSRGGFNDNPNVLQFRAAYRKLLAYNGIMISRGSNCQTFQTSTDPFSSIAYVSSRRPRFESDNENEFVPDDFNDLHSKLANLCDGAQSELTDCMHDYSLFHTASLIERRIQDMSCCVGCSNVIERSEKVTNFFHGSKQTKTPCTSTFEICKAADRYLKVQMLKCDVNFNLIYYSILNDIDTDRMFTLPFDCDSQHKFFLIRTIVDAFIQMKGSYLAREMSRNLHDKDIRKNLHKLLHFYGV